MKRTILTAIALAALSISWAQAQQPTIPVNPPSIPGSPGTPTPMPYPPVTPSGVPTPGPGSGPPLLPPIEMPKPPKDQPIPGLEPKPAKAKSPGG
ncbi:hypothetical protein PSH58_21440 [Pseudomonas hefeiensis]|uniref:Uncharacterized protein n=1 Tax=Pseudomonas hefeiensis TaxID=2738125 RepID=A0ABY9G716_9PSED|nr:MULTISPECIES: hypothetical protein [unclassified Pseudomonas]WLH11399.1 hypothetical protein PSH57_21400 [Pseudomonas sp. FP205]WLH94466.1 hypothetical protein PSH58_21440 [Pseudomonas sp. FP53]WLI38747.1 hypothetical protein PSH74_21380 [Pseudomonas sp. FP821]